MESGYRYPKIKQDFVSRNRFDSISMQPVGGHSEQEDFSKLALAKRTVESADLKTSNGQRLQLEELKNRNAARKLVDKIEVSQIDTPISNKGVGVEPTDSKGPLAITEAIINRHIIPLRQNEDGTVRLDNDVHTNHGTFEGIKDIIFAVLTTNHEDSIVFAINSFVGAVNHSIGENLNQNSLSIDNVEGLASLLFLKKLCENLLKSSPEQGNKNRYAKSLKYIDSRIEKISKKISELTFGPNLSIQLESKDSGGATTSQKLVDFNKTFTSEEDVDKYGLNLKDGVEVYDQLSANKLLTDSIFEVSNYLKSMENEEISKLANTLISGIEKPDLNPTFNKV